MFFSISPSPLDFFTIFIRFIVLTQSFFILPSNMPDTETPQQPKPVLEFCAAGGDDDANNNSSVHDATVRRICEQARYMNLRRKLKAARCLKPTVMMLRRCRRLFTPATLLRQTMQSIITTTNPNIYANIRTTLPTSLYQQLLLDCIVNCTPVDMEFWLAVAKHNGIDEYDLTYDMVVSWRWPHITLEQCFLFRCYDWTLCPEFLKEENNRLYRSTPHFVRINGCLISREDSLCAKCIVDVLQDAPKQDITGLSVTGAIFHERLTFSWDEFLEYVPGHAELWCRLCKVWPLFTMKKPPLNFYWLED